ncbi:MAG: hypothetical protein KA099_06785 [Alphaproteobacteria bacterium]|nr:hypothetical protein [Alphaproteobacteria bacterium]MBP7758084.1 hypothetical protein [Alphaproteobacteria bacterium]MBP7761483.1 hypothetical protein [Alphaproteobacteria bacterium]MBP7905014.1 hypothetical protein [Alphaproteobacteria bacterium]
MKRTYLGLFALLVLTAAPVCGAFAAEEKGAGVERAAQQKSETNTGSSDEKITDPVGQAKNEALHQKYASVMATLDTREVQHFAVVIVNYNLISTVKAVGEDVQGAVNGCAENNSEIAETVKQRFVKWKEVVAAPMAEAEANVNNMVLAQDYLSQTEFSNLFGLIEDVRRYNSSRFEKTPVTTPEACEFMLSKMDETQEHMVGMLKATLVSYPSAREKTQE